MYMTYLHHVAWLVLGVGSLATIGFIISILRNRNDIADVLWGMYFIVIGWLSFFLVQPAWDLRLVCLGLVSIWGIRLAWHIGQRHRKTSEDARYRAWRDQWGTGWYFYVRSWLQVFLLQGLLALIISLPVIIITLFPSSISIGWMIAGIAVWLFGFLFESIGDHQLKVFLANPENKGHIMRSGLWNYSRHPNYFGEIMQWWGLGIMTLSVAFGWIGLIGPLVITFLIVYVSGIPLAEKNMLDRPEFIAYKKTTSPLIPLPRFITRTASPRTIAAILIEFGPLILFFIMFELFDFMTSVIILMITVSIALAASVRLYKKIAIFPLIASGSVVIFGLLTVLLNNPFFIIFKDTLYFGIFAIAILIPLIFKRLVLKSMFSEIFAISDKGWTIVSINWGIFMALVAGSNEIARIFFSSEQWVGYKFIVLIILIVFGAFQFLVARYHRLPEASAWGLHL